MIFVVREKKKSYVGLLQSWKWKREEEEVEDFWETFYSIVPDHLWQLRKNTWNLLWWPPAVILLFLVYLL